LSRILFNDTIEFVLQPEKERFVLSPETYAKLLRCYLDTPACTIKHLQMRCNVGKVIAKKAMTTGWPKLNLPALPMAGEELLDPTTVHKLMSEMIDARQAITANLFGPIDNEKNTSPTEVVQEANRRAAEAGMATRIAQSTAAKAARVVSELADKYLEMIANGDIELPEKIRPEHILMLTKAADAAASAINKAAQADKLQNGEPEDVAGSKVTNLLIGANPEELRQIMITGNLPKRLLGLPEEPPKAITIDVESVTAEELTDESTPNPDDDLPF
jgi:hypothetical protein